MADFWSAIEQFATECEEKFANLHGGQPEDQLKAPIGALLTALGPLVNCEITWRTEVHEDDVHGRPDIGVIVNSLLCGHIELKAPDVGARPETFKGENKKQFDRFKALPNLIYTDGSEWSLYRSGELKLRTRIATDIRDGAKALIAESLSEFRTLFRDFSHWEPITPTSAAGLAQFIAPLSRILRDEVSAALGRGNEQISQLADEWRRTLMPEADDDQFADAYAQTLTYALLLARFEGAESLNPFVAVPALQQDHALLAAALQLLEAEPVRKELRMPIELLERAIGAIDGTQLEFTAGHWLYFYEDFLAAYDPKLRKDRGVYFTPIEVVECQVRLADELLRARFDKELGFAEESVRILDPAVGTGTYPLAIVNHAAAAVVKKYGAGAVPQRMSSLADRLEAFELLVGPYAVARLRITQRLHEVGAANKAARVYLANTLSSPNTLEDFPRSILQQPITDDRKSAHEVKNERDITVCIGNPPYDRGKRGEAETGKEGPGGWVVHGDIDVDAPALFESFTKPVVDAGQGGQLKNLYNSYVYFWRWAMWKVFESPDHRGIVTFITASSYLRGPGFAGMRRVMRETFDELWIIDLEGDNLGARKTDNVFAIQSPVAIAIGVRAAEKSQPKPAQVRKTKLTGTLAEKLASLDQINTFDDIDWRDCSDEWDAPFYPVGKGPYFDWPPITEIFPWQQSGVKVGRTWPIGESPALAESRWRRLASSNPGERVSLFVNRPTGRKADDKVHSLRNPSIQHTPITDISPDDEVPTPMAYGLRSLDRQHILSDARLIDRSGPPLWTTISARQVYLISFLTEVVGHGPDAIVSAAIPDLHHFRGSFGGQHVIPLYRDADATQPNVASRVLDLLKVSAEDLFAYVYGILAQPAYVERFWDELELPPPHLPITKDAELLARVAEHGRNLICWHTYGERFAPDNEQFVLDGTARNIKAVSQTEYPNSFDYDEKTKTLYVGEGEFGPVEPEVYNYTVSGLEVVKSWLGYRMKDRKGRKSSPLDDTRPEVWTFSEELLELLWVLEHTIAMQPTGKTLLEEVLASELWTAEELPKPTEAERKPPKAAPASTDQLDLGV
ncbi:MAG: N-6 DNA methylase [Chloroflexota bacterium]|nr:N-6 DNA methylase [Chloroflexota bacterium]